MDKPRCQGCLGELKVERPEGGDPYVWCLRCGARDDREPRELIALLEPGQRAVRPRESAGKPARYSSKSAYIEHSRFGSPSRRERRDRSSDAGSA